MRPHPAPLGKPSSSHLLQCSFATKGGISKLWHFQPKQEPFRKIQGMLKRLCMRVCVGVCVCVCVCLFSKPAGGAALT